MRNSPFWWVFISFMLLLDFYVFQAVKLLSQSLSPRFKTVVYSGYWAVSLAAIILLIILPYLKIDKQAWLSRSTLFALLAGLFFAKLVASLFFLLDDLRRGIQWSAGKVFFSHSENGSAQAGEKITRSAFMSWMGLLAGGGLYGSLIYGFGNKYRYEVKRVRLSYPNLPASFRGKIGRAHV